MAKYIGQDIDKNELYGERFSDFTNQQGQFDLGGIVRLPTVETRVEVQIPNETIFLLGGVFLVVVLVQMGLYYWIKKGENE